MKMSRNGKDVLYEGWLTKSPPTDRIWIWRGRWRKRWFSLHMGDLPAQFFLAYYTDRNCRKLKGLIDLDHCEQVDTGLKLEDKKFKFDYLFSIKTQPRTYYLAADTDEELRAWVKYICDICGLKATNDDEDVQATGDPLLTINKSNDDGVNQQRVQSLVRPQTNVLESAPFSTVSTSPYIPISECITGKSPMFLDRHTQDTNNMHRYNLHNLYDSQFVSSQNHTNLTYETTTPTYLNTVDINESRFYDSPRLLIPQKNVKPRNVTEFVKHNVNMSCTPLQSPTDSESVFTDDDCSQSMHSEQGVKIQRPSDSSNEMEVFASQRLAKLNLESGAAAPPRPPKPFHINISGSNYLNLSATSTLPKASNKENIIAHGKSRSVCEDSPAQPLTDDMYDFPRSHQLENDVQHNTKRRHCYNNAAPVMCPDGQIFKYDISPKTTAGLTYIFRYDAEDLPDVPASPSSQSSSTVMYSNLPSPLLLSDTQLMPPPAINRGLKPKRKMSDSVSVSSSTEPSSPRMAPTIDRNLKPPIPLPKLTLPTAYDNHYGNIMRKTIAGEDEASGRKIRAAPSPVPVSLRRSHDSLLPDNEQIYHFFPKEDGFNKQNYHKLEYLDLDLDNKSSHFAHSTNIQLQRSPGANTVYKKVDFMKTQAFNITRNNLEKERKCTLYKK